MTKKKRFYRAQSRGCAPGIPRRPSCLHLQHRAEGGRAAVSGRAAVPAPRRAGGRERRPGALAAAAAAAARAKPPPPAPPAPPRMEPRRPAGRGPGGRGLPPAEQWGRRALPGPRAPPAPARRRAHGPARTVLVAAVGAAALRLRVGPVGGAAAALRAAGGRPAPTPPQLRALLHRAGRGAAGGGGGGGGVNAQPPCCPPHTPPPAPRPPPPARRGSGDPSAPARPDLSEGRGCRRSPCGAAAEGFPWHRWDSRTLDLRAAGLPRRAGSRGGGRGLLSGGAGIPRGRWRAAAASPGLRSPLRRRSREGEVAARCEPPGGRGQRRGAALSFSASSRVTSG